VIGGLLIVWRIVCDCLGIGQLLFAAGAVFLPVLVTGGIHMDGFCDVNDARASYADKEKRLEIMSDPHRIICCYNAVLIPHYTDRTFHADIYC
ncbi:MAG: adenosylcobinamide-GDP ribazoletransferase, partial [Ruminococcus sp.]|nr:adenosylcobinamide-GDP ribazoletransferase [Ruminococcus sp.]